jgi:Protein of unknown function (DUF1203)
MSKLKIVALPTKQANAYRQGHLDANGQIPERQIAVGTGNPCRHCLIHIKEGDEMLVLAHRPFEALQPYAELGPIFLHSQKCVRYKESAGMPAMFNHSGAFLVRGYGHDNRIKYQAASIVKVKDMAAYCAATLGEKDIAYLHVISVKYNCYQCRVERC